MPSVMITGAGRGFGWELLNVYLKNGWTVFPLVRNPLTVYKLVLDNQERCFPMIGDVTSDSVVNEIQSVLEKRAAGLDVLINNAGSIRKIRGIADASPDDMLAHFNVHCVGAFRCTKAALPFLKKASKPVVVNISSRWGAISRAAAGKGGTIYAYNIAKSGQNMLSAMLHYELKHENIGVFSVHPGRLQTSVAAPDADTPPDVAAQKLFDWIEHIDDKIECRFHDLMGETVIEW